MTALDVLTLLAIAFSWTFCVFVLIRDYFRNRKARRAAELERIAAARRKREQKGGDNG